MTTPLTLHDLVAARHPGALILTESQPIPVLGDANVVALFDDDEKARAAVRRLEDLAPDDGQLGVVTFTPGADDSPSIRHAAAEARTEPAGDVDPEGVAGMTARRATLWAVVAFVVVAVSAGLAMWLLTDQMALAVATGIGLGLLVAAVGAMVGAFSGFGGSDAWRQTFSPPGSSLTVVAVVGLPPGELDEASRRLRHEALRLDRVDAAGRPS